MDFLYIRSPGRLLKPVSWVQSTAQTGAVFQLSWVSRRQGTTALLCRKVNDHEGNVALMVMLQAEWRNRKNVLKVAWRVLVRIQVSSWWPWSNSSIAPGMPSYLHAASQLGEWANIAHIHLKSTTWTQPSVRKEWINNSGWLIKSDELPAAPKPCRQRLADSDFSDSCVQTSLCNCPGPRNAGRQACKPGLVQASWSWALPALHGGRGI